LSTDPRSQVSYGKGMYKSTDAGKTWTHIGLDPGRRGMLWAGTSVGVYVSFDQQPNAPPMHPGK